MATGLVTGLGVAAPSHAGTAAAASMSPYTARYQVSYRGLSGGEIEASFRRADANGLWQYETRAFPNFFGRIAVSPRAH